MTWRYPPAPRSPRSLRTRPELEPDSAALIADLETSSPRGEHLDVNIAGYSIPLYWADASTPRVEMGCRVGGLGFEGDNGMDAVATVPMPEAAAPDPESDHHLLVIDRSTSLEWGFWDAVHDALVIAYPHIRSGFYTPPASTGQARIGDDAVSWRGIPRGGRIQLDPDLDLDALGLSRSGRIIARALQVYGAYVGDYSGAISLYAESSPEAQAYWASGVLDGYELTDVIDLAWLRVLRIGPLYDNGNGD